MAAHLTPTQRLIIYHKTQCRCAYCGKKLKYEEMTIDHIVPQKESRDKNEHIDNSFSNLVCSCRQCNLAKGSMSLKEFRKILVSCRHFFKPRKTFSFKFGKFLDINVHTYVDTYVDKPIDRQFKFYFEQTLPETLKKLEKQFGPYRSKIQLITERKRAEREENTRKQIQKEIESYSVSTFIHTFLTGFAI